MPSRVVALQVTEFKAWAESLKAARVSEVLHVCKGHQDSIDKIQLEQ